MSASLPKADMCSAQSDVRFVPKGAKPAKTRRSRSKSIGRYWCMQSDRPRPNKSKCLQGSFCLGIFFVLAIEHMGAYICGITDLTLGVSG